MEEITNTRKSRYHDNFALFLAMASSTAFNCLSSSSRRDEALFFGLGAGGAGGLGPGGSGLFCATGAFSSGLGLGGGGLGLSWRALDAETGLGAGLGSVMKGKCDLFYIK